MRVIIPAAAAGLVLAAALPAQAQTFVTSAPSMQTIQTTETVRTVRPTRNARHEVVTTRTVTRQVVPAAGTTTVIARPIPAPTLQPLYDTVSAPVVTSSDADYDGPPLYDTVAPVTAATVPAPFATGTAPVIYRYVYEPDRILVIDPATNIAIQSIPR
ncbi:MAG TPA: hypothetical protein VH206_10405 [Xanthobacteraceae bacterium]|jgi:hypothetical protein|nr:hypothetical protein [Xanthobacteraceae bacterium]